MRVRETVRSALRSLRANGMRTALTSLGMIIGVAAVVAVLAIGEGARESVESRIRSLGANLLMVRPGAPRRGKRWTSSWRISVRRRASPSWT